MVQDGSCLDEKMEVAENGVLGWAASFGVAQQLKLEAGQYFVNRI